MAAEESTTPSAAEPAYEQMQDIQVSSSIIYGITGQDNSESPNHDTSSNSIRSRGSKVSNLRAAFEQSGSNEPPLLPPPPPPPTLQTIAPDRRVVSSARPGGFEAELSRLKDVMARDQQQRDSDKQRMLDMQEELEHLREQLQSRRQEEEEVETGSAEQPPETQMQEAQLNGHFNFTAESPGVHAAQTQDYEDELARLRNQLGDMKRSIATNTRIESHEMTDSAIQGEFGTLCYLIQDWVINTYRKIKIEKSSDDMSATVDTLPQLEDRTLLKPLFQHWDSTSKLVFLQAAVGCLILPVFRDPMPFGLPANLTWSDAVRLASDELQHVLEPTAYARWRATTFDIICHSEFISPFVHSAANRITEMICTTIDHICGTSTPEAQADILRNVIRRIISLSHSLRIQRASYDIQLPSPGSAFNPDEMEGVSGDHDGSSPRTIQCAVFPAVFKISAGRGLIFKARVSWKDIWD